MRRFLVPLAVCTLAILFTCQTSWSQTSLSGSSLSYQSVGSATLSQTGYVGTYLTVPSGGATVNFDVNATGSGSAAHMNVVIANSTLGFNIDSSSATNYDTQNVALPGGTYFVQVQRDYDNGVNQSFAVNNLSVNTVSGATATFANDAMGTTASNTDALNASNTYINNYRKGSLDLSVIGAAPGTPIEVKEVNSAFKWGTAVPDNLSTYIPSQPNNPASYTATQTKYTTILNKDFNSVEPENAGKWSESDTGTQLSNLDLLLNYASQKNMRVRQHNLIWGSQQPTRINSDFTNARSTNATTATAAMNTINGEINTRIANYVGGTDTKTGKVRASEFAEIDVYNESYHTGAGASVSTGDNYWKVMSGLPAYGGTGLAGTGNGAAFAADVYNRVQTAVTNAGASTKLFTNEYNVLNSNADNYGQWYSQQVESIRNANGPNTGAVSGIGTEWYNSTAGVGTSVGGGDSQVTPARAYATWQNLAAQGLPLEVTEFGESVGAATDEANGLTTAMTLAFGTPQMTGFQLWGYYFYGSSMFSQAQGSVLYDNTFNITAAGTAYEALMKTFNTDVTTMINPDGTVSLPGGAFYGDYQAIINGKTYNFTYSTATNNYTVTVAPLLGDLNLDGHVDAADISAMLAALADLPDYESSHNLTSAYLDSLGDVNHDGQVNNADVQALIKLLISGGGSSSTVPEPASLILLALAVLLLIGRQSLTKRCRRIDQSCDFRAANALL
jgi:hypothetical protein